jgi:predicted ferric reductase
VNSDLFFWAVARVAGLGSFAALSIALFTGVALRGALLDWLAQHRSVRALHEFSTLLWIPLALVHVSALMLDHSARIGLFDLVVPFRVPYGTLAIGVGTISAELFAVVALTGWLRHRLNPQLWLGLHRLAYAGFGLAFVHALLAGTDFSDPVVSALTWSTAAAVGLLSLSRLLWGRLPA